MRKTSFILKNIKFFFSRYIKIIILVIFFLISNKPQPCLSEDLLNLSGKFNGYNLILITMDALRPDHLSCYGYSRETSPNIDAIARQGIIFNNAFSQSYNTLPGLASIYSSLYPFSHRLVHVFKDKMPDNIYTLAQIFEVYGYKTVWFGDMQSPYIGNAEGLLKGYSKTVHLNDIQLKDNHLKDYYKIFDWIKDNKDAPFFITIHSKRTHERVFWLYRFNNKFTHLIPKEFLNDISAVFTWKWWQKLQKKLESDPKGIYELFGEEWFKKNKRYFLRPFSMSNLVKLKKRMGPQQITALETFRGEEYTTLIKSFSESHILHLLSLLDSSIFEFDKEVFSKLVEELKKKGIYDKTIIVISADHGNEFFDHGNLGHGNLYDECIHVPLIFYIPNLFRPLKIDKLVQSIDIMPTVFDLLNIPIPSQAQGISLVGLMEGKNNVLNNEFVYAQGLDGSLSIRSNQWKLIQSVETEGSDLKLWKEHIQNIDNSEFNLKAELFNIQLDKKEKNNVIRDNFQEAQDLRRRLKSKLNSLVLYQKGESEFVEGLSQDVKKRIIKTGYW